jgi:hypothetical protein
MESGDMDGFVFDLLCMADMYAHKCTKQQEKFDYYQRHVTPWRWEDCQAAFELLRETGRYFELRRAWINGEARDA